MKKLYNSPHRAGTKEYHAWYNREIRGQPVKADSFLRVKCLVCGNLAYPTALDRVYETYAKLQRGYRHYYELGDPALSEIQTMLYENMNDKYKKMAVKCTNLLRRFMSMGLITEADIRSVLGFQDAGIINDIDGLSRIPVAVSSGGVGSPVIRGISQASEVSGANRLNYLEDVEYG